MYFFNLKFSSWSCLLPLELLLFLSSVCAPSGSPVYLRSMRAPAPYYNSTCRCSEHPMDSHSAGMRGTQAHCQLLM